MECQYCGRECQKPSALISHEKYCKSNPERPILRSVRIFVCPCCDKEFEFECSDNKYNKLQGKKFCSRSCANKRVLSNDVKSRISKSLAIHYKAKTRYCKSCGCEIQEGKLCDICKAEKQKEKHRKLSEAGRKSAYVQRKTRRSKNEILFFELCNQHFNNVIHNEPIFNGWDADVILLDEKIAILWNGPWHYRQLIKSCSLKQIQTRDAIKAKEIEKAGYYLYIIKDEGQYNPEFVKSEFEIFLKFQRYGVKKKIYE